MKQLTALLTLIFLSSLFSISYGQSCSSVIVDNVVVGGAQLLKTKPITLVVRGNYSYSMELMANDHGIQAKMSSLAGVELNQDDEIIFMNIADKRKSFRFIEMGEISKKGCLLYTSDAADE